MAQGVPLLEIFGLEFGMGCKDWKKQLIEGFAHNLSDSFAVRQELCLRTDFLRAGNRFVETAGALEQELDDLLSEHFVLNHSVAPFVVPSNVSSNRRAPTAPRIARCSRARPRLLGG